MRITEKKLQANRQNAKKSTGPKTEEGKAVSSLNAAKYGLYARSLILNSPHLKEDRNEYDHLIYDLVLDLQPEGLFEGYLVRKIANCLWRSRRLILAENARIASQLDGVDSEVDTHFKFRHLFTNNHQPPTDEEQEQIRSTLVGQKSIPDQTSSIHLLRYEMRLDRQLTRTIKLLTDIQNRRKAREEEQKAGRDR